MSRYFNYIHNNNEFSDGFTIVKRIIKDILEFDINLVSDKEYFIKLQRELKYIDEELGNSDYSIRYAINDDMISPRVVNYYYEYKKYPDKPSPTGERINELFNRVFEIEDEVQVIVSNIWNKMLTPFEDIQNGMPFTIVGHSGVGYIVTPLSGRYIDNDYQNTASYSCSIFTPDSMNTYSSNLVMLFDINSDNYISACSFDCATSKVQDNLKTVKLLKITEKGKGVSAGYTYNSDIDRVVSKVEDPSKLISKIKVQCQVVLVRPKTNDK